MTKKGKVKFSPRDSGPYKELSNSLAKTTRKLEIRI